MANNQHLSGQKVNTEYFAFKEKYKWFATCIVCQKQGILKFGERFSTHLAPIGWRWISDGTEDGVQTCSDECRALLEIAR